MHLINVDLRKGVLFFRTASNCFVFKSGKKMDLSSFPCVFILSLHRHIGHFYFSMPRCWSTFLQVRRWHPGSGSGVCLIDGELYWCWVLLKHAIPTSSHWRYNECSECPNINDSWVCRELKPWSRPCHWTVPSCLGSACQESQEKKLFLNCVCSCVCD